MPITDDGNRYYTVTTGINTIDQDTTVDLENAVYEVQNGARLRFGNQDDTVTFTNCRFIEYDDAMTVGRAMTDAQSRFPAAANYIFEDCEWMLHQGARNDIEVETGARVVFRNTTINHLGTTQTFYRIRQDCTLDNLTVRAPNCLLSIAFHPATFTKGNGRTQSFSFEPQDPNNITNRAILLFDGSTGTTADADTTYRISNLKAPNVSLYTAPDTSVLELIDPVNTNGTTRITKATDNNFSNRGVVQGWRTVDITLKNFGNDSYNLIIHPLHGDGAIMIGEEDPQNGSMLLTNETAEAHSVYVKDYQQNAVSTTLIDTSLYTIKARHYKYSLFDSGNINITEKVKYDIEFTIDENITLTETQALALTGIEIDFASDTITLTESRTLSEIYDYWKAQFVQPNNLTFSNPVTWNGSVLNVGDYNIVGLEHIRG